MNADTRPQVILELEEQLQSQRWRHVSHLHDKRTFGNSQDIFVRSGVALQIVRDRSQWFFDVGRHPFWFRLVSRKVEYFDLDLFIGLLEPDTELDVDDLDRRVSFIVERLDEICGAVKSKQGIQRLRAIRAKRNIPKRD
ncbi:MAG: hypothetical protein ACIAQF_03160 [Phycisphaerales bacterium JB065]